MNEINEAIPTPTIDTPISTPQTEENQHDLTIFFNQEQFAIIKEYRKIHRFLFKH
jgi:hypothetical protein